MKRIHLYALALCLLTACSKKDQLDDDREGPSIELLTPAENAAFPNGSTVVIEGSISDANRIVQVHLHISSLETGQLLMDVHRYPGNSLYELEESFGIPAIGEYRIQVIARDNAGNEGRQTVTIRGL